jgi:O-6-methylguanine DNA methyltransferase
MERESRGGVLLEAQVVLSRARIETPLGPMLAIASPDGLCALEFDDPGRQNRLDRRLQRWLGPARITDELTPILQLTRTWLGDYFSGGAPPLRQMLGLDPRGTPFELRVWSALLTIPPGTTTTYGELARRIGSSGGSRAVGMANGANAIAVVIPCHRVIGADGTLTGYGGGLHRKEWLLAHERRWRNDALF